MSALVFYAVLAVILLGALALVWSRLVRDTTRPGGTCRVATCAVVALTASSIAADAGRQVLPREVQAPLDLVGFGWLGALVYLVLALLALEPLRWWLLRRDRRHVPPATPVAPAAEPAASRQVADASRRLFLSRSLAVTAGAVTVGTVGYGTWAAAAPPVVRRVRVAIDGLAPELAGYRITTFSDAHLSSLYGRDRFARLVRMVNATEPDLVAVVGDLVDGSVADLRRDVAPLGDIASRDGTFFVTGNHEYYVDTAEWMAHLPTLGVDVLRNERVALSRGGAAFDLAGVDDVTARDAGVRGHGADLTAALAGRAVDTPVVLLAHQPVQVEQARTAGVDLQLSGHTHGGQLWPLTHVVGLEQPAVRGLSRHGDTQLYVTAGVGCWGPPMRVGARPELTVVELVPT